MEILTRERVAVGRAHSNFNDVSSENDQKTTLLLLELGFFPKLDGYDYIRYATGLILTNREYLKHLTSVLYPIIAEKFSVKSHCVERSIRHALDAAIATGKIKNINEILGAEVYRENEKFSNGELLSVIAEAIRLKGAVVERKRRSI